MVSPDDAHEPFRLGGFNPSNSAINQEQYPFWRSLDVAALNGFENLLADCTAGSSRATIVPMIAMMTSNSTSVKARLRFSFLNIVNLE